VLSTIRSRLVATSVAVALGAAGVTAVVVARGVETLVGREAARSLESDVAIYSALVDWAATHPHWAGVDDAVAVLAAEHDRRIALEDADGTLIVDSADLLGGAAGPRRAQPDAVVDALDPAVGVLGTDLFDDVADAWAARGSAEDEAAAAEVLRRQEAAARACLAGDPDGADRDGAGPDAGDLDRDELGADDLDADDLDPDDLDPDDLDSDDLDPDELLACLEDAARAGTAPVALLYLGSQDVAAVPLHRLGAAVGVPVVAAVLALAAGAAWTVAARLASPLARLTATARRLGSGDLDARVGPVAAGEVGELGAAFDAMADALARDEQVRRRLVADVAHELRNPLTTIAGTVDAVRDGVYGLTDPVLDSLAEESEHLQRLVEDLQVLATADAGRLRLDLRPVDLAAVAAAAVTAHAPAAASAGVDLRVRAPVAVAAHGDAVRLRQVVANLLSNALRHARGTVRVEVARDGAQAVLTVQDDGPGIPAEQRSHVFDRFWRADTSRARTTGGSGLGLAIVRELVHAHGGTVAVGSAPDEGATFTVRLPAEPG